MMICIFIAIDQPSDDDVHRYQEPPDESSSSDWPPKRCLKQPFGMDAIGFSCLGIVIYIYIIYIYGIPMV